MKNKIKEAFWKKEYTLVLTLNIIYILVFFYVMTSFC